MYPLSIFRIAAIATVPIALLSSTGCRHETGPAAGPVSVGIAATPAVVQASAVPSLSDGPPLQQVAGGDDAASVNR